MRAIFFDLDGTLLVFHRSYREILVDAYREVVGEVPGELVERYDEAFYEHFADCRPAPVRRAVASVAPEADPGALARALLDAEIEACRPPDPAETDLPRLAEDYRLGVLTNGVREWQERKLRAHGLDAYFDAVVASYEVGAHKPDVAAFEHAGRRLPADRYAMVGDDDADIDGASSAGWTAYRYNGDGFGALPGALDWE